MKFGGEYRLTRIPIKYTLLLGPELVGACRRKAVKKKAKIEAGRGKGLTRR
jgi:hypothetical protein